MLFWDSPLLNPTGEEIEKGTSNQCKEWNCFSVAKTDGFAFLFRLSEFRKNFKYHGSRRGEI